MKHHLITAIIMALFLVPITSHAYDFSAVNDDGVTIYYNILSEEEKTCEVTYQDFYGTSSYKEHIIVPSQVNGYKVTAIGMYAFNSCSELTSVELPNTITILKSFSFCACYELKSIKLPNSVTDIEWRAFLNCNGLKSVIIPKTLKSIGNEAFQRCKSLETVTSYITEVFETGADAFDECENATLYVPKGLIRDYQSSADWNRFKFIKEFQTIPLQTSCNTDGCVIVNDYDRLDTGIGNVDVLGYDENVFTFIPKDRCRLYQVILNGLDITANVQNNTLTCTIPANSQMIVTFTSEQGDMNNDGTLDISDVVTIVNKILGN